LASLGDPDAPPDSDQRPPVTVEITAADVARLEEELNAATEGEADMRERLEGREALVDAATQMHAVATAKLMRIAAELAEQEPGAATATTDPGFEIPVDELDDGSQEALEFYLLARLAGLRNVSFAGSVPLVIDDAFRDLPADELRPVLLKLEKMAEAVQVIYLTDDEAVTKWAVEVGFQRAAVVDAPAPFR
jgi:hypothetical protein